MTNLEIQEKFGFTIDDAEFKKNYLRLLEEPLLTQWIEQMGKPDDYNDLQEYYFRLSFMVIGWVMCKKEYKLN